MGFLLSIPCISHSPYIGFPSLSILKHKPVETALILWIRVPSDTRLFVLLLILSTTIILPGIPLIGYLVFPVSMVHSRAIGGSRKYSSCLSLSRNFPTPLLVGGFSLPVLEWVCT